MKRILTVCGILFLLANVKAADTTIHKLQNGDLLFQNVDCGPLCDAIEAVTDGCEGQDFSHIGLVYLRHDSVYVIEAIGKDVHLTYLTDFTKRSKNALYIGRVKQVYKPLVDTAVNYALQALGTPYDDAFLYNNNKYYCAELIYDAFMYANKNTPFFALQSMTFKMPGSDSFFPAWVAYYNAINMAIPEAKPGINPGSISLSDKINIIGKL